MYIYNCMYMYTYRVNLLSAYGLTRASCAWRWCWRRWRISAQVLELALCQVHRQVSEPLLELRAPLVRQLPAAAVG